MEGKAMTVQQIAHRYGYPQGYIRGMCHREKDPIPHIECGGSRPVIRIRPEQFEKWRDREEGAIA